MIGGLRHRLVLQSAVLTSDGVGGHRRHWEDSSSAWGWVRDFTGSEDGFGTSDHATRKTQVKIRWRDDITSAQRFLYGERILNIVAVLDKQGKRRFLTCLCEEDA